MRYSETTGCFYPDDVAYEDTPPDLIDVPDEDFREAMARPSGDAIAVASGRIVVVPRPAPTVEELRQAQWLLVKRERDRRCDEGGYYVSGHWFHSDARSRIQQLGLVLLGASLPPGLQWKTMSGAFVEMTPTLAQQILGAAAASDNAIFVIAEGHRVAIAASSNPAGHDWTVGWPAVYGE